MQKVGGRAWGRAIAAAALLVALDARADPAALAARARAAAQEVRANEALVRELAGMVAIDQWTRERFLTLRKDALPAEQAAVEAVWTSDFEPFDSENVARLKVLLKGRGWFRRSEVGRRVADGVFHVVQHSGDVPLMKSVLAQMEPMVREGEADGQEYAMLYDRLARWENRPQRYGTQFDAHRCEGDHYAMPDDLEDAAHVDALRRTVGLDPLADYLKDAEIAYGACRPKP